MRALLAFLLLAGSQPAWSENQKLDSYPWAKSKHPRSSTKTQPKKKKSKKKKKTHADAGGTEAPPSGMASADRMPTATPKGPSEDKNPFPGSVPVVAGTAPLLANSSHLYAREFESGFGQLLVAMPSVAFDALFKFRISHSRPLYLGIDGTYSLFSTGYYLSLMPGLWYNFTLRATPFANLTVGLLTGPAFCKSVVGMPNNSYGVFGEASISFELDDLTTVRGQFRPGIVGGRVAFSTAMLIGFRFR